MSPGWLRTVSTFCLGALLGVLATWGLRDAPAPVEPRVPAQATRATFPPSVNIANPRSAPAASAAHADPPAPDSLSGILQRGTDFEQTVALYDLIRDASAEDIEALIGQVSGVPGGVDRRAAVSILYARYADLDPDAAVDHLLADDSIYQDVAVRAVFHAWARSDLEAALARAATLDHALRSQAGGVMLLARHDLSAASQRDIAERLDIENVLHSVISRQSMDAVASDPQTAWTLAAAEAGPMQHQQLAGIAMAWARQDPMAAMNAVQSLNDARLRNALRQQVIHEWSRQQPGDAVNWAMSQPSGPQRAQFTAVALRSLAASEPRTAFELAQSLPAGDRDAAVGSVLGAWAESDPRAAAAAFDALTDPRSRQQALHLLAREFVQQDAEGAVQWLTTLSGNEAQMAGALVFSSLAQSDPAAAGALVGRMPEQIQDNAAQAVVQGWVQQDPYAAASWIDSAPSTVERATLTRTLLQQWSAFDRDGAVRYAERLGSRAEREAALVGIIQTQHEDMAFAEMLYDELTLEPMRRDAARTLYFVLQRAEPARADRYRWAVTGQR